MQAGSLLIVVAKDKRPRLEYWAKEHHRSTRDEAAYLVEWALEELDRRTADDPEPAAA